MVACKRFGYGTGKALFKNPAKRFRDKKATRMTDPLEPTFVQDDYPDCRVKRTHRGDLEIDCFVPERGYSEKWHWNGNHQIDYEDGSQAVGCTGTKVTKNKQGENATTQYAKDTATYNHFRQEVGNDGNQKELPVRGGAISIASAGDDAYFTRGISTRVTLNAAQGGFHGAHYATNVDVAMPNGSKGGIGHGVSNKGKLLCTERQKSDGEHIFQILPPPNSENAGVVTVQYKPDGTIMITTKSTHTTINGGTHTIKAPRIVLDGPVYCTSTLEASESLTAPHCHSCADRAKGTC